MKLRILTRALAAAGALLAGLGFSADSAAQSQRGLDARSKEVIDYWTPARINSAIPRDLVIDHRGLGYVRGPGNSLTPHGHDIAAQAGPPGAGDTTAPVFGTMNPGEGDTIGAAATLSAVVTDVGTGVRSVTIYVKKGAGVAQSFNAGQGAGNVWSVNLSGFTNGTDWTWWAVAKDGGKPANSKTSATIHFTVDTSGGGGGGSGGGEDTIPDAEWTGGGVVQRAAGRIYFEMPANARLTKWNGYVCSGTAVNDGNSTADGTDTRSIILTAAHCVYDDANRAFARNVMFIPDQAHTTAAGTDRTCSNDPIGCWVPNFGVVDVNWTTKVFPDNVHWDYAFYVVKNSGAHQVGIDGALDALDAAVTPMTARFTAPTVGDVGYALGYSYDVDPSFRYCTDPLESLDADNWWLPNCELSGGSSGGPWVQLTSGTTFDGTNGEIISVNSWGYTTMPGMAGPKLSGTTASCVFKLAKESAFGTFASGAAGYKFSGSCAP
jgi:hypothetical protein